MPLVGGVDIKGLFLPFFSNGSGLFRHIRPDLKILGLLDLGFPWLQVGRKPLHRIRHRE